MSKRTIEAPTPICRDISPALDEIMKRIEDIGVRLEILEKNVFEKIYLKTHGDITGHDFYWSFPIKVSNEEDWMWTSVHYVPEFYYMPKIMTREQIDIANKKYEKSREK